MGSRSFPRILFFEGGLFSRDPSVGQVGETGLAHTRRLTLEGVAHRPPRLGSCLVTYPFRFGKALEVAVPGENSCPQLSGEREYDGVRKTRVSKVLALGVRS